MKDSPLTPTTVRPLRVLAAIAAGAVAIMLLTAAIHEGSHRYRLWRADGTQCVTLSPDGTLTQYYGAEACGY